MIRYGTALTAVACAASLLGIVEAEAQARDRWGRSQPSYVVAESRFGHGTVRGAVRLGATGGWEVQMPGGTWIPCRRNCADTLRAETVDFWENQGRNRIDNEPGLFGDLSIRRWF